MNHLKVGDKIRITAVSTLCPDETAAVFKHLIKRKKPLVISFIDEHGQPWYEVKLRRPDGRYDHHALAVLDGETNWKKVE